MIGNKYLESLYINENRTLAIRGLLADIKSMNENFLDSITEKFEIENCNEHELHFLTVVSTVLLWKFVSVGKCPPAWTLDDRLSFKSPYYYNEKILTDFDKIKLIATAPTALRSKNVYFDVAELERI